MLTPSRTALLSILSVGFLLLLTLVSAALLGLSVMRLTEAQTFERVIHVLPSVVRTASALRRETKVMALNGTSAATTAATKETTAAKDAFVASWNENGLDELSESGLRITDFKSKYGTYAAATTGSAKVFEYGRLTEIMVEMVNVVALTVTDARAKNSIAFFDSQYAAIVGIPAMSHVAAFQKVGHFASVDLLVSILKAQIATNLHIPVTDSHLAQLQKNLQDHVVPEAKNLETRILPMQMTVVESTVSSVIDELTVLGISMEEASARAINREYTSQELIVHVIQFCLLMVISGVCCGLSIVVLKKNWYYSSKWHDLLEQFHDADGTANLREVYKPLIKDMKTMDNLPASDSEVEQPFQDAANVIKDLRPFVPQTLFGDYATADGTIVNAQAAPSKRKPAAGKGDQLVVTSNAAVTSNIGGHGSGGWNISDEAIRLETGSAVVKCTVMLVAAQPPRSYSRTNGVDLQRFNDHVLAVVTTAVNKYGGVMHHISSDGRVLAMWNATHTVSKPAFEALKAAEQIRRKILQGARFDINISTGSCLVCNTKIVNAKQVLFFGYAFELVEKMLTLNRIHEAWLVLDSDTYDAIPRANQTRCKPVGVLHGASGDSVVILSYGSEEPMKGARWKAYNTAFTLYRHGFIADAITEYKIYIDTYPNDLCANWLLHTVLMPNQYDPVQALKNKERVKAGDERPEDTH